MTQVGDVITLDGPSVPAEWRGRAFAVLTVEDEYTLSELMLLPDTRPGWCWAQHPELVASEMEKRNR